MECAQLDSDNRAEGRDAMDNTGAYGATTTKAGEIAVPVVTV